MNITRENIKETLRQIMAEETEYQTFFKKALEKAGKSIPSMSDEEKKEFFNKIDAAWNAKGEKNEDLKGNQHKLDVDGDGEIEASDLAALRAGKKKDESVNELHDCGCGCGGVTEGGCQTDVNEEFKSKDSTFEKVYSLFDKKDYFNAKGLAKVQIGNFERALQKNDKGAQQILDKFKGDMDKAKDYIIQVITDRKKEDAFNQYKAFKAAVDSIQKGKPIYGAVDLVKSRIHNNSQKYTMALYSALRNQKFNKWKDIHADVDSLIGESITEGRAFVQAARTAKEEGKTEFEFNGKKYPVTLKESYKGNTSDFKYDFEMALDNMGISGKAIKKISKKGKGYEVRLSSYMSDKAAWEKIGKSIGAELVDFKKGSINIGLYESLNERRLGKVEMLKDVEAGRTSRVEGVKISKDLAFEMRMFLQRPMLSRSRTGIAIDNSQMKEAIPMLAKVGIHKRLSSGVKKEFAELLKKYK